jgi:hypothetical protein
MISPLVLAEVPEVSFGSQHFLTANGFPCLASGVWKGMHLAALEEASEFFLSHPVGCFAAFSVPQYLNVHSPRRF